MRNVELLVGLFMSVALIGTSCADRQRGLVGGSSPQPRPSSATSMALGPPKAEGSCRSIVARRAIAGSASVDWISLGSALSGGGDVNGPVLEFTGITDVRQDQPPTGEGPQEPARVVTLQGVQTLRGELPTDAPLLATPYQLADAQSEVLLGVPVLARVDAQIRDGRRFIGMMMAVRGDGSASFLGDCIPRWTPALAKYTVSIGMQPSGLAPALLVDTAGPVATAFLSSAEARTPAGP